MQDEQALHDLKKIVKKAVKDKMPDEKLKAWKNVHNFLLMQELVQRAIASTPGEPIELGEGSYTADIVIVTQQPPTKEELALLQSILQAIDIEEKHVYRTIESKWSTSELTIIEPLITIYFGSDKMIPAIGEYEDARVLWTHPLGDMLDPNTGREIKNAVWTDLKEVMKFYDQVKEKEDE